MMESVEDPAPWQRGRDQFGPWGHGHRGPFWLRRRGHGGPLRRDPAERLAGGVASGVAAWKGLNVTTVRIAFVLIALVSGGFCVPFYVAGWLLIPAAGEDSSIGSRARSDSAGIALAVGLATLLAFVLFVGGVFNDGWFAGWAWPQTVTVAGLALIWRNASPDEQATLRRLVEPLGAAGAGRAGRPGRRSAIRLTLAGLLVFGGAGWLFSARASVALLRPLGGVVLVIAGIVLLLGPWWLRIARDLVLERQAKVRAEERADISAQVHDSVLQTLALIQRRADDPQKVVWLARMQERELRSWLFEGRAPGEATVNAAKWSGAGVISLFAEVEPDSVSIVVRDRGKGFDPSSVPTDRKGLAESVHGRMVRRGGTADVVSAEGEGTKVTLRMARPAAAPSRSGGAS
jgi:phage shock protein PspC (stress-responsive transcriptional regulator)